MLWEEIRNIKSTKKELRSFGAIFGILFLGLFLFGLGRYSSVNWYLAVIGAIFLCAGLLAPQGLYLLHKIWMAFAIILGNIVSTVILWVFFFAVITPIGIITRLSGKDFLDRSLDAKRPSYWRHRSRKSSEPESYEHQY